MSRSITIWYSKNSEDTNIEIGNHYMFGTQKSSKSFWALEVLKEIGVNELSKLGDFDPIYFSGWDQLKILNNEIKILEDNIDILRFDEDRVTEWIKNLKFCCDKLLKTATQDSIPNLMIG